MFEPTPTPSDELVGTQWVRELGDVDLDDAPVVGGKAANLGHLHRIGIPVPAGFCLTTAAFDHFVAGSDEFALRTAEIAHADDGGIDAACTAMRAHLGRQPIPADLRKAVVLAWTKVGRPHRYAVRSSAVAEDGESASFAGQLHSSLNVIGIDDLLRAAIDVWSSWFQARVVVYRRAQGLSDTPPAVGVVIQRMVMADRSGVLFTADPVTGHRHTAAVDAVYGLGEAFVSGRLAADNYTVNKHTHKVLTTNIAHKMKATRARRDGGTYEVEVSPERQRARVLTDSELATLVELGNTIERHRCDPQDIEWCFEGKKTFVVQTRPITTLFPLPAPPPDDPFEHVHICVNHFQVMTDAMPPLACSAWAYALPFGKHGRRVQPSPWVRHAGGRVFLDLSKPLRSRPLRAPLLRLLSHADTLAAKALDEVTGRPGFAKGPRIWPWSVLPFALPTLLRAAAALLWRDPERLAARAQRSIDSIIERLDELEHEDPGEYLVRVRDDLSRLVFRLLGMPPLLIAALLAGQWLRRTVMASPGDFAALERGLAGNVTTEMDLALGDVADLAFDDDDLREAFAAIDDDPGRVERTVANCPNITFTTAWSRFLTRYGVRASAEIDPSRPRWREQPIMLLRIIASSLAKRRPGTHRRHHADLVARADHVTDHMIAQARRTTWGAWRARWVGRLIRIHRTLLALREHPKWVLVHAFDHLRRASLAVGDTMVERGQLRNRNDVWFLELDELIDAYSHPRRRVQGKVDKRRADHLHHQRLVSPRVLTAEGENPRVHYDRIADRNTLIGTGVSHGDVVGRARVVTDPTRDTVRPGEVLVAPFTDPGWTPLFLNASALVMEVGGMMTHGSVVAREFGIPAVVCVPDATRKIVTGQRLRVDGERGVVEIMDDGVVAATQAAETHH